MSSFLIGLVGSGIGPSLTPALHEREADELGLRYLYRRLDLDTLPLPVGDLLTAARITGYRGLNITHPAKQAVLPHLDECSAEAGALGAVNTVLFEPDGRAIGHNTDAPGFATGLRRGLPGVRLDEVVLLGAGGAGSAVGHALLGLGAGTVTVFDADQARAVALAESLRDRFGADTARAITELDLTSADGLVNATPIGMWTHPGLPLSAGLLHDRLWVADVVYRPLETELITTARALGCRVLTGGRMAVFQAAHAFRLFTGQEPDADRMLRHFDLLVNGNGAYVHN